MTTQEIEAVYLLNLYRSYSKAAAVIGSPVSTLSQRVSNLEKELGGQIFTRSTKKDSVQLTELGRLVMPGLQKILSLNSDIHYQIENNSGLERTVLRIGMPAIPEYDRVGRFLADFAQNHKDAI